MEDMDSVTDLADALAEDDIDEQEETGNEDSLENENQEGEETSEEPNEESEESNESQIKTGEIPQYKEITKKYPTLFKDFPHLKHTFFQAREYRELFPTVDEAKEAASEILNLRGIESALSSGKSEGIQTFLTSLNGLGENVVNNFAGNFLPTIAKSNQDLYYQVITPELVKFTRSLYDAGIRNSNDNMKNSALQAALHFFGDAEVASGKKEIKSTLVSDNTKKGDPELDRERQNFRQERYTTFYNEVVQSSNSDLEQKIMNGLDPQNKMSSGMKEVIVEKVIKEMAKVLSTNPNHTNKMNALWKQAGTDNFNSSHKSKIVNAYLNSATEIMPKIRAKVRANILGIRERSPENAASSREKRIEPKNGTGGGRTINSKDVKNAKDVDWSKTSDIDFLKGNVTVKGR